MYYCDSHIHSVYSFDSTAAVDDICTAAINAGLAEIALTDHYDAQAPGGAYGTAYNAAAAKKDILAARSKYSGRLKITYGIELGQPTQSPDEAKKLLSENDFEFVIGSLHNLDRVPDFYYMKYDLMSKDEYLNLWKRYLCELSDLIDFDGIDTVAHLTYPIRYFKRCGIEIDLKAYYPEIEALLNKIIEKGLCLEVNASGYRQNMSGPLPDYDIIRLYFSLGGRDVTVGSDAHRAEDVGAYIAETYRELSDIGFSYITAFSGGTKTKIIL